MTAVHNVNGTIPGVPTSTLTSGLNTEASITLSQSMDSVNTTPDDEFNGPSLKKRRYCSEEPNFDGLDVRTLFVSGLPMDAKPRELYLLFRSYKGYESALLKITARQPPKLQHLPNCGYEGSLLKVTGKNGKSTSPVGFVTFSSRADAEVAKQDLQQGVRFDPDLPQTLRLEFAKSNTKVTKPKQQQSPQPAITHPTFIHPITGHELGPAFFPGHPEAWAAAAHPALHGAFPADLHNMMAHHPTVIQHPALAQVPFQPPMTMSMAGHPGGQMHHAAIPNPHYAASPILGSPVAGSTNTTMSSAHHHGASHPASSLMVTNLGPFCSEQELKDLFSSFRGFIQMKMSNKGGMPVAIVEYQDVRCATDALNRLQGFILLSSERGGIQIEYTTNNKHQQLMGGEVTTQILEGTTVLVPHF